MKKTIDKSNNTYREKYNFSGWGNTQFKINISLNNSPFSTKELAKKLGVAKSTIWRVKILYARASEKIIKKVGDYDTDFRMAACRYAIDRRSVKEASKAFECSKGSIYNWLKAYDLTQLYFIKSEKV